MVNQIVKRLSVLQTKLGKDRNGTKDSLMFIKTMPEHSLEYTPVLKTSVHCFMAASNKAL